MNTNLNETNMRLICSFLVPGPEFNQQWFVPFFGLLLLSGQDRGYVGTPIVCFLLSFLHLYQKLTLTVLKGIILRLDLCFAVQTSCIQTDNEALC